MRRSATPYRRSGRACPPTPAASLSCLGPPRREAASGAHFRSVARRGAKKAGASFPRNVVDFIPCPAPPRPSWRADFKRRGNAEDRPQIEIVGLAGRAGRALPGREGRKPARWRRAWRAVADTYVVRPDRSPPRPAPCTHAGPHTGRTLRISNILTRRAKLAWLAAGPAPRREGDRGSSAAGAGRGQERQGRIFAREITGHRTALVGHSLAGLPP